MWHKPIFLYAVNLLCTTLAISAACVDKDITWRHPKHEVKVEVEKCMVLYGDTGGWLLSGMFGQWQGTADAAGI